MGTGIKLVAHTTLETLDYLQRADVLFYGVSEPATELWLQRLNASARTLNDCYAEGKSRDKTYRDMTTRIVNAVRGGALVCAAFYGHPGVFVDAAHASIRRARREGFRARMLPGISTEDCLFADLGIDPGVNGCQSFEATDFLACRRRFDPTSALILWQAGALGEPSIRHSMKARPDRLRRLTTALRKHYDPRHPVVLYEAPQFPISNPRIRRVPLAKLAGSAVWSMTTLYLPPKPSRAADPAITRWFDEP